MALRSRDVRITDEASRDKGKLFVITEMAARPAEKWATRAFLALARSGVEIPEEVERAGMAGIAVLGFHALAKLQWSEAEPLLDEMMDCVSFCPDPARREIMRSWREMVDSDIEEVLTIIRLRAEVFELHTGFSLAALRSKLTSAAKSTDSSAPQTSPAP